MTVVKRSCRNVANVAGDEGQLGGDAWLGIQKAAWNVFSDPQPGVDVDGLKT